MACTLIDHRNDVRMFRTQVVLMQSFEHFDVISMIDKSIETMEYCHRFLFFTVTLTVFEVHSC